MKHSKLFDEYVSKWRIGRPMTASEEADIAIMRTQFLLDEKRAEEANIALRANKRKLELYSATLDMAE